MEQSMEPKWLKWAKQLQAISQTGLAYTDNKFDIERYKQIRDIAAEILAEKAEVSTDQVLELFIREKDYATPKVDVRAAAFRNDKILLVKESSDHKWTLPGGWADVGESPSESVARETFEESGFEVKPLRLVAVYDRSRHEHEPLWHYHIYKLFFFCEITSGRANKSIETEDVDFFAENQIPQLSLTKVLPKQIRRMFEYHRNDNLPVDFD